MSEGVNRGTVAKNRKKPLWKRIMKGILAVVLVVVLCISFGGAYHYRI